MKKSFSLPWGKKTDQNIARCGLYKGLAGNCKWVGISPLYIAPDDGGGLAGCRAIPFTSL